MNTLAIDLGSTACKASVIALDGQVLGSGLTRVPTTFGEGGLAEQDPDVMWTSTLSACRQALSAAGTAATHAVRSICVTSQWSSIVPVDADGLPVAPLHMWFDRRGEPFTAALTAGDDADEVERALGRDPWVWAEHFVVPCSVVPASGRHPSPNGGVSGADGLPECPVHREDRGDGKFGDATRAHRQPRARLDDLVRRNSSSVQGSTAARLPELTRSLTVLAPIRAEVADDLGLRRDVDVVTGSNDSIAAAFGSGALGPGQAHRS